MARKSKYAIKERSSGYAAVKSGRTLATLPTRRDCELFLQGFTGITEFPAAYQRVGFFYA